MLNFEIDEELFMNSLENFEEYGRISSQVDDESTREKIHNQEQEENIRDYNARFNERLVDSMREFEEDELIRRGRTVEKRELYKKYYDAAKADILQENELRRMSGLPPIDIPEECPPIFFKRKYRPPKYRPPKRTEYFNEGDLLRDVLRTGSITARSLRRVKKESRIQGKIVEKVEAIKTLVSKEVKSDIEKLQNSENAGKRLAGYGAEIIIDYLF